jgi:Flp pilus assembly protein TadD
MRAKRKEEILSGMDAVASRLRRKLGESLASIQRFDTPTFRGVSTRSFEAFRAWEEASRTARISRAAAIPFDLRAVELDPDFASAHAGLAILYNAAGEVTRSAQYAKKAWELRGQVREPEKFLISAQYYLNVTGELEKIPPLCRVWSETYPNSFVPHERAASAYTRLGQFQNARSELQQARQFGEDTLVIEPLASVDIELDRLRDARILVENSLPRKPDNLGFRQLLYRLSFLAGDTSGMQNQVVWAKNKSDVSLVFLQAATEAYFGRLKRSRELADIAAQSARYGDFHESDATRQAVMALHEAEFGYPELARQQATAALETSAGKFVRSWAALALAQAKGTAEARKLADQLNSEFPTDTLVQNYWVPTIRAEIELTAGNTTRALELLREAEPYELSAVADQYRGGGPMLPVVTRGRAYLLAADGKNAIREFQKILQHRGLVFNNPEGVLTRLGLARGYALGGNKMMARAKYQEFLELWKGADPDIPILNEAQSEYARLNVSFR